jgi:hypothetical protein
VIRIDVLPDEALLEIFKLYMKERLHRGTKTEVEKWHSLVHVCRRWRHIVFRSPHHLNLQLVCTPKTPSRDTLDVWPALPLIIEGNMASSSSVDDIAVALGHSDRVCEVYLWEKGQRQLLEKVLAAMQVPFPELTALRLSSRDKILPVIPDSFLGGSVPRLQFFKLSRIPFPGLPKLLLSATHLARLDLYDIPHSGYISPKAMVAALSVLSSLKSLSLAFISPQSHPDLESRQPPPLKRSVIPSLTLFSFKGVSEYLEDLVTCIDGPRLSKFYITFFNQIDFDSPQLADFIHRTPRLRACDQARVQFEDSAVDVKLTNRTHKLGYATSRIQISCRQPDWQLSSIIQVYNSSLPPQSMVEDLYIEHQYSQLVWKNDAIENTLWLQLLLSFPAVKNLYLSKEFAPGIAAALQELVGGRITEILPSLQHIFVEKLGPSGGFRKNIREFVATRQLSGHPVTISAWNGKEEKIAPLPLVPPTAVTVKN